MDKKNKKDTNHVDVQPDEEILHSPDPQEHMKGPVSSFVQGIKEEAEKTDKVSKEEATRKKDENT